MTQIRLGTDVIRKKPAHMALPREGLLNLLAPPRYGKTSQGKNMAIQMATTRKTLILDVINSEWESIGTPNFRSPTSNAIRNLTPIESREFGFYLSDLSKRDLRSMDFTESSATAFQNIVKSVEDDVGEAWKIVLQFPTDESQLEDFQQEFPDAKIDTHIPQQTKTNMVNKFKSLIDRGFFMNPIEEDIYYETDGQKGRMHFTQKYINEKLLKGNIRINFNLSENDQIVAQFYVGKIMEIMRQRQKCSKCVGCKLKRPCTRLAKSTLERFQLCIIAEEADKLFPKTDSKVPVHLRPISLQEGVEYITKQQRQGFLLWAVSQKPELLNDVFYEFYNDGVHGRLKGLDPQGIAENLLWDKEKNLRHFVHVTQGSPFYTVFEPDKLSCMDVIRVARLQTRSAMREPSPAGLVYNRVRVNPYNEFDTDSFKRKF